MLKATSLSEFLALSAIRDRASYFLVKGSFLNEPTRTVLLLSDSYNGHIQVYVHSSVSSNTPYRFSYSELNKIAKDLKLNIYLFIVYNIILNQEVFTEETSKDREKAFINCVKKYSEGRLIISPLNPNLE